MKNRENIIKMLYMLKDCIAENIDEILPLLKEMLAKVDLKYQEICLLLFLIGEYTRISGDMQLYIDDRARVIELQDIVKEESTKAHCRIFDETEDEYGENYGMAYGALYNSNLFAKRENIAESIHQMKNYAYEHYTCAGKLVDKKYGDNTTAHLLWICVPFGLFTPEDLVLVAALDEIEKTEKQDELAMLGWYFAEKADYKKARSYLARLEEKEEFVCVVKEIIEEKLKQAGMLSEAPILHIPLGNFNRYEHQNYERNVWFPKAGEEVILNAVTWPVRLEKEPEVFWHTDTGKSGKICGVFQQEYENYCFSLGTFEEGEEVTYFFKTGNYSSTEYTFTVLKKEIVVDAGMRKLDTVEDSKQKKMYLRTNNGDLYIFDSYKEKGIQTYSIQATKTKDIGDIIWKPFKERMKFESWKEKVQIQEISFFKCRDEIFSIFIKVMAEENERFYGFGERYNQIDQRENVIDVYVYNQYKNQGIRTYFPMPYFLSSKGYGIWMDTNQYSTFDMCSTEKQFWSAEVQADKIKWYCFNGNPKEMIGQFTSVAGKPVMMPEWAFGPWMSSNNWDSQEEVCKQVELTKKYDIPSTVLVIEAWSDEATYYIFNDAMYQENSGKDGFSYEDFEFPKWGKWPNPKGMVEYLHENGLKCILWQIPIIKYINSLHHLQKDMDETYALEHEYCAKKRDGSAYRMPEGWFTGSLLMDYTSSDATEWYFNKRKYLVEDIKIDGFKTDGGEFVFGEDVQFSDGRNGKEMRNAYPNLYIGEHYKYIHEKREGIVFSRAGYTGASAMPAHWAGDERSTFSAFKRNLCAGLNAGISGIPFWGWDLAGFSGEIPTPELYVRSTAMATFCPIMQYHAESKAEFNQDRTPWNIAERCNAPWVIDVYRYYAKLRMAMIPYIVSEAKKCVKTGVPLMRALCIEFPKDVQVGEIYDQYMFGDDLMVAPIVEEGSVERKVYVPEGNWKNIFSEEHFTGGKYYQMKADIHQIIVLQKEESSWEFLIEREEKFLVVQK